MQFSLLHLAEIGDEKLFCVAFASRVLVALYMLLADLLITDYDSSAELYALKFSALRSVSHWDAVHFRHIARFGYSHEQLHAFFPAMPLVIRFFEFTGVAEIGVALFVASCYSLACVCLRHLTRRVLQPESYECLRLAVRSDENAKFVSLTVLLFLISPATVFTVASYTESPFALLSMGGMLLISRRHYIAAGMAFAVATFFRSNGIVLAGFFVHHVLFVRNNVATCILCVLLTVLPYALTSYWAFQSFCPTDNDRRSATCPRSFLGFYDMVQLKYWGVGWFTYYTVNNIPNFLIALPLYSLVTAGMYRFFATWETVCSSQVMYLLGLMALAATRMHVQVVTRFVFSCPALYWVAAALVMRGSERTRWILLAYCTLWGAVGCTLFANFYPWT